MAYSIKTKTLALELSRQGYTSSQISKLLGPSSGRIRKWTRIANIGKGRIRHPVFIKERAKRLYYTGINVKEIADKLHIPWRTIYDWLQKKLPRTGNRCSNWRGGINPINLKIRKSEQMQQWRLDVFKRDNFTCVCCAQTGGKLQAHHILSFAQFPNQRFNIKNGVTLCRKCHKKLHGLLVRKHIS